VAWAGDKSFATLRAGKLVRNYLLYLLVVDYLLRCFDKNVGRLGAALVLAGWAVLAGFIYSTWLYGGWGAIKELLTAQSLGSQVPELAFLRQEQGGTLFLVDIANWTMMNVFLAAGLLPRMQGRRVASASLWTYVIAGICALLLSLTRGAIIALVIGMLIMGLLALKTFGRRQKALLFITLAVVAIALFGIGLVRVIAVHFATIPTDLSELQRLDLWRRALEAFVSAPWLGVGAGNVVQDTYIAVHNLLLQVLGELGLLGGVVFGGLLFYWLSALIRIVRQASQRQKNFVLVCSVLAASVAYLVYSLVSAEAMEGMEVWILLGVTTALLRENQPSLQPPRGEGVSRGRPPVIEGGSPAAAHCIS
jgi:O-antigen ligase